MLKKILYLFLLGSGLSTEPSEGAFWTISAWDRVLADHKVATPPKPLISAMAKFGQCSAGFISGKGLFITHKKCVLAALRTNHHLKDHHLSQGYRARTGKSALRISKRISPFLIYQSSQDVTHRILDGLQSLSQIANRLRVRQSRLDHLLADCQRTSKIHCEIEAFDEGSQYQMHQYLSLKEVRLVYLPPMHSRSMANQAGDEECPQWQNCFAILRAYTDEMPFESKSFFHLQIDDKQQDETMISMGFPPISFRHNPPSEMGHHFTKRVPRLKAIFQAHLAVLESIEAVDREKRHKLEQSQRVLMNQIQAYALAEEYMSEHQSLQKKYQQEWTPSSRLPNAQLQDAHWQQALIKALSIWHQKEDDILFWHLALSPFPLQKALTSCIPNYQDLQVFQSLLPYQEIFALAFAFEHNPLHYWETNFELMRKLRRSSSILPTPIRQAYYLDAVKRREAIAGWLQPKPSRAPIQRAINGCSSKVGPAWTNLAHIISVPYIHWLKHLLPIQAHVKDLLKVRHSQRQRQAQSQGMPVHPEAGGSLRFSMGHVMATNASSKLLQCIHKTNISQSECFQTNSDLAGHYEGALTLDTYNRLKGITVSGTVPTIAAQWLYEPQSERTLHIDIRYILWMIREGFPDRNLANEILQAQKDHLRGTKN